MTLAVVIEHNSVMLKFEFLIRSYCRIKKKKRRKEKGE
jgi:hypothetical protein